MTATTEKKRTPTVVVAGSTGFIGTALAAHLEKRFHLVALTRSPRTSIPNYAEVRQIDLFSSGDAEKGLEGADYAIYLVHSMMPSARLVQASFRDLDLLCADNFAKAAAKQGVRHIIYVGGIQPEDSEKSEHLESRVEVERVLESYGVPVTTLRAGLIIGGNGSSFQILRRLILRLPVMLCPSWTNTRTNPVALPDVIWAISHVLDQPGPTSHAYDLGGPTPLTYKELMATTARVMGKKRRFIPVPLVTPNLSRLWVSLVTGAPKALVSPLISSLRHEMIARDDPNFRLPNEPQTPIEDTLAVALQDSHSKKSEPRAFQSANTTKERPKVLSVQRMILPKGASATWAAEAYMRWLPHAFNGLVPISVHQVESKIEFRLFNKGPILLCLERRSIEGTDERRVFRVSEGFLALHSPRGRMEFRQVLDGRTLIVAIHEFIPRLPWWIYRVSQAVVHSWIMRDFARYLASHPEIDQALSNE
jgi:uncharacterized protein YbjT (DUF2867 family)